MVSRFNHLVVGEGERSAGYASLKPIAFDPTGTVCYGELICLVVRASCLGIMSKILFSVIIKPITPRALMHRQRPAMFSHDFLQSV